MALEENTKRVNQNPGYYWKRQQIAEHMYGILRRQRGLTHTNVQGKEKVPGVVGLMFLGYNINRCLSIFGEEKLIRMIREHCSLLVWRFKQALLRLVDELISEILKKSFFYILNYYRNHLGSYLI